MERSHRAVNPNWEFINSKKYPPGRKVTIYTHGKFYEGEILYRYVTINKRWRNLATAILCKDGKVRTAQIATCIE